MVSSINRNIKTTSAVTAPAPVPIVPPDAPKALIVLESLPLIIAYCHKNHAADTLTKAFTICSKICEIAVGTMVERP